MCGFGEEVGQGWVGGLRLEWERTATHFGGDIRFIRVLIFRFWWRQVGTSV